MSRKISTRDVTLDDIRRDFERLRSMFDMSTYLSNATYDSLVRGVEVWLRKQSPSRFDMDPITIELRREFVLSLIPKPSSMVSQTDHNFSVMRFRALLDAYPDSELAEVLRLTRDHPGMRCRNDGWFYDEYCEKHSLNDLKRVMSFAQLMGLIGDRESGYFVTEHGLEYMRLFGLE